jgi:hypothetical protein
MCAKFINVAMVQHVIVLIAPPWSRAFRHHLLDTEHLWFAMPCSGIMIIVAVLSTVYTIYGGLVASIYTDQIQGGPHSRLNDSVRT